MLDQFFRILNRNQLDAELANLFRRWEPPAQQRADFVGWAWMVAAAADVSAYESASHAVQLLRVERDLAHRQIAEKLHTTSSVDLHLVSKRMFLDWLAGELVRERAVAA